MLESLTPPKKVYPCRVREIANSLSKEDAAIFLKAVVDPNWPVVTLADELKNRGIEVSPTPITKHRKGVCSCA
jgi:hypothetical protein